MGGTPLKWAATPHIPGSEPEGPARMAALGGLDPHRRTLPPDFNEWLKAQGLEPIEEAEEETDNWNFQQAP